MKHWRNLRVLDGIHIPLWLLKDISWLMVWKPLGIIMIFPTVIVALILCVLTIGSRPKFLLNLAILFWLLANSNWMLGEFFEYSFKPLSLSLFILGIICMVLYGLYFYFKKTAK